MIVALVVGSAYLLLTLPHGATRLAQQRSWGWLGSLATWADRANQLLPDFEALTGYIRYALIIYVVALMLLALRHGSPALFGVGVSVLMVSTVALHVLAWLGFLLVVVCRFVLHIIGIVLGFVASLLELIERPLRGLVAQIVQWVSDVFTPLLGAGWWIGAIGTALLVMVLLRWLAKRGPQGVRVMLNLVGVGLLVMVGLCLLFLALRLLVYVLQRIGPWLSVILGYAIMALLIWLVVTTVGQLLLDQLKGAVRAGNGQRGVVMGAIAVGSTLAVLLLVANLYHAYDWYPPVVADFAARNIHQDKPPTFDASVTLLVVSLSVVGVLRNIPRLLPQPSKDEFGRSMIYTILGVVVAGALSAVGARTEH